MPSNKEAIKKINQVGENFGWQVGRVPANYANGYMQAVRDCKAAFYGLEKEEPKKYTLEEVVEKLEPPPCPYMICPDLSWDCKECILEYLKENLQEEATKK